MAPAGSSGLFLGVSFEPHSLAVAEVLPGGPAYLAKLRKGDVIGAINEKPLQAVSDIPASLLRRNEIKLRRDERARNITIESANLHDERAVVALLLGKGDRISGSSSIKLFQRCDANCNCVDGGMACERWYTLEGRGTHGGILMMIHCRTIAYDSVSAKTESTENTRGPLEYF